MIYFYGNAMCLNYATPEFDRFRRLGFNVLIPDYVGYGMSGGSPSEKGCQATADAAYDYLVSTRGVDPRANHLRRLVAGRSRRDRPGLAAHGRRADRLQHVHEHHRHGPDHLSVQSASLVFRHRFDSLRKIAKIACPILIGHGRLDSLVPFAMFERAGRRGQGAGHHALIDQADHNDFFDVGGRRIDEAIATFVDGALPRRALIVRRTSMTASTVNRPYDSSSSRFSSVAIRRKTPSQSPRVV